MSDDALTLKILREIRDEIRNTRTDLGSRIEETNSRLNHVETALVDLAEQPSFVVRWLKAGTQRDRQTERDIIKLTGRVDVIEARLPDLED